MHAIERVIVEGPHTPDMKGKASTMEVGTQWPTPSGALTQGAD